jgi:glycosyltransferase involved in cell wall biosynthesis
VTQPPPPLSVGLPVYNGEKFLGEAIDSLLGQTFGDFELIISDNASTDQTGEICREYAQQDARVRYIRQPHNIGLSPNHNFVADEARGKLFKWAAADDLYGPGLLRGCVQALDERPDAVLAHSWTAAVDAAGNVTQAYSYPLKTESASPAERFRSFLFGCSGMFEARGSGGNLVRFDHDGILRACDEYGVIRTRVLRSVAARGSYHDPDRILITELLLRGPFAIIPDWMYFRRDHDGRAHNSSLQERCAILDPRRASRLKNPPVRLMGEYVIGYVGAIRRAPISPADRRECLRQLALWVADHAGSAVLPRRLEPFVDDLPTDRRRPVSAHG